MEFFDISFLAAFLAGLATFFSPCLAPVLPGFFAFLGSENSGPFDRAQGPEKISRKKYFFATLTFISGFLLIFILLGIGAKFLGTPLGAYKSVFEKVGGIFLLFLGVFLLGLIKIPVLYQTKKFSVFKTSSKILKNFFFGVTFGFAWTPCIGPILGSVLYFASGKNTAFEGAILLAFFALGIALPFLLFSLFVPEISKLMRKIIPLVKVSKYVTGVFLILLGITLFFGYLGEISGYFTQQFGTGFVF